MRISFLFFLLFLAAACTREATPAYTIVRGQLPAGSENGSIGIGGKWESLPITEGGTFVDTLTLTIPNYVDLSLGDFNFWVYLAPGDEVIISADSTLNFSGDNAAINDYLYQDVLAEKRATESFEKIFRLKEADFVAREDSLKTNKLARLAQLPTDTEAFQDFHRKGIEYDYQLNVARYPMYHSYHFNDYEPTEIITETYQGLSLDHEEDAKRYGAYRALVGLVIDKRTEHSEDTSLGPLAARLAVLRNIQSPTILEQELKKALYYYNVHVEDIKEMRDRMLALAQSKETKEAIDKRYAVISELQPGSFSPSFNYENYAGGHTGLEDFRGKYVYVDVWATWCGPCIKEIPHLKKMEEDFRDTDLAFVSISIDELKSREKWRRMIADRELGGTQLLADRDWESEFIRSYGIRGIPHFILLDDRGRIVSAEVERPSDPKLRERLQTLDL